MKSGTSFFNGTAFRKNITRFLPVWTIYLLGCILVLTGIISGTQPSQAQDDLEITIWIMAMVNLCYALLNAELLFGDLFNSRLCIALHSMPLRREGWFLTNVASGLCFGLVPNLVLALCFIPRLEWYWASAFQWMLAVDLEYLFFFALALFCVFCTGSRFATALVYGLINFLALLMGWLVETLYIPQLKGVMFNWELFHLFCPIVQLADIYDYFDTFESWIYLIVLAVLGVALLAVSLQMYRKRKLECAGDFVAIKGLAPVFQVIYTLTVGTVFHLFSDIFLGSDTRIAFLMVGLVIGYFTGEMLIQRTVQVFKLRSLAGLAILAAVLLGTMGITRLDPLGVSAWIPKAEQVSKIELCHDVYSYYYNEPLALTEEEIPAGLEVHRQLMDIALDNGERDPGTTDIQVVYTLTGGRQVHREYQIPVDSPVGNTLNDWFSAPEHVLKYEDWDAYLENLVEIRVEDKSYTGEAARELLMAVKADCEAGTMTQDWEFHDPKGYENVSQYTWMSVSVDGQGHYGHIYRELVVFEDAVNTVAWLQERETEWRYDYSK